MQVQGTNFIEYSIISLTVIKSHFKLHSWIYSTIYCRWNIVIIAYPNLLHYMSDNQPNEPALESLPLVSGEGKH